MAYKGSSLPILVLLLMIIITASPLIYIVTGPHYYFAIYLIALLVLESVAIMKLSGMPDKSIGYFLESIRNGDLSVEFPVNIRNKRLRKIHESLNRINHLIRDTRAKQAVTEQFYLNLIQHSASGLIALDPCGEIRVMNDKAFDYLGLPPNLPADLVKTKNPSLFSAVSGVKGGQSVLEKIRTGNRMAYLSIQATEIKLENGIHKLISIQDIRQELDEKEMDSWIRLIRILSHEILNSIAPITSLSDTLKRYFKMNDQLVRIENLSSQVIKNTADGLETIEERGKGLLAFVNNFRKLTSLPEPEIRAIPLVPWMKNLYILIKDLLNENKVSLNINYEKDLEILAMDENLMSQVMLNLLYNAIDALKEKDFPRTLEIGFARNSSMRPFIRVTNNGSLIPEEIQEKIFMPFYTTKKTGSGIGLSLSRQIVRLHGGSLHVESGMESTSFIITL